MVSVRCTMLMQALSCYTEYQGYLKMQFVSRVYKQRDDAWCVYITLVAAVTDDNACGYIVVISA